MCFAHFHKWMWLWAILRLYFNDNDFFLEVPIELLFILPIFITMKGVVI